MSAIDKESPIPAYYQIQMDLSKRIESGEWSLTGQLPAEAKLAEYYDVSRLTLRQALAELEKDGLIKKSRGRGAVICESPRPFVHKLDYSLVSSKHATPDGYRVTADMLSLQRFDHPYEEVAQALQIAPDAPVVYMKRLFSREGKPLAVGRSWLSLNRFPGLDMQGLEENRLSATLYKRYRVHAARVEDSIEAVRPTPGDCKLLDISYDCPLLSVRGISYDEAGCPVEYSTTLWLGDKVRFKIAIHTPQPEA